MSVVLLFIMIAGVLAAIITKSKVLKAILIGLIATTFYAYVGQWVPQKETHPPKKVKLTKNMTSEQLAEIGKVLVEAGGKGTCSNCHISPFSRAPKLEGIGTRAKTRINGMSDVDYLAESIYKPDAFVVPNFAPIMPAKPGNLKDKEVLAVIAYLQSLGGKPTVTLSKDLERLRKKYGTAKPSAPVAKDTASDKLSGKELFKKYNCHACHKLGEPGKLVGPSLYDVGKRLKREKIHESIMTPDAVIAEGYTKGMMKPALGNFYKKVTEKQIKVLVDFLASKKGK